MQQIVINKSIGGMSLSLAGLKFLVDGGCRKSNEVMENPILPHIDWYPCLVERDTPLLLAMFKALGNKATSEGSQLKLVEIPVGIDWYIFEDETGVESVHEQHRSWS